MNLRGNPMAGLFARGLMWAVRIPGARLWAHKGTDLLHALLAITIVVRVDQVLNDNERHAQ